MKRGKPRKPTLAATLDRTRWDYSPDTDRSFLLTSVERLFASVAWEITPQHLAPRIAPETADVRLETAAGDETDRWDD